MGKVIGEYLPLAVGLAIIPIPVIAVILMLFSDRARANSLAFLIAWVISVAGAMVILVGVASTQDLGGVGEPSRTASTVALVLGLGLIALAVRKWRDRSKEGGETAMPGWMSKIDSMKPLGAAGLAVVLAVANPKNLILIVSASVIVAQGNLSGTDEAIAVAVFTLIGSLTVAIPTLAYLFLGEKIRPALNRSKSWLRVHSSAVMAVLLVVIGMFLIGKGISGLS